MRKKAQTQGSRKAGKGTVSGFRRFTYQLFYRSYGQLQRWQDRLTPRGLAVLSGAMMAAMLGLMLFDSERRMAYHLFVFLFALAVLSLLMAPFWKPRFSARRELPRLGTVGSPVKYILVLRNDSPRAYRYLSLKEVLPDARPTLEEFARTQAPGEQFINLWDRTVKYPRWEYLVERGRMARYEPVEPFSLGPWQEIRLELRMTPQRRGVLWLKPTRVLKWDPFRLFSGDAWTPASGSQMIVLPRRYTVPPFSLGGMDRYQVGASQVSSAQGQADEFVALREYRPGDPPRHIHWRTWARLGRPIVKEFEDEFFPRNAMLLDTYVPPGHDLLFEESVSVAASFACSLNQQESLLDLIYVGTELFTLTAGRGQSNVEKMLEVLSTVEPRREDRIDQIRAHVIPRLAELSGCALLFSTWDESRAQLLRDLEARDMRVLAVLICHPHGSERSAAAELGSSPQIPPRVLQLEQGRVQEGLARLAEHRPGAAAA